MHDPERQGVGAQCAANPTLPVNTSVHKSSAKMANPETAAVAINVLNKVIRYAVGLGVGASILQTSLYNGT